MIRCYNPIAVKTPQKIFFSCFLGTKILEPDLAEIWPAYCQIVFLEKCVGDFCFLFPFSNSRHFSKEVLMICPL